MSDFVSSKGGVGVQNITPKLIKRIGATDEECAERLQMSSKSIERLRKRLPAPIKRMLQTAYGRAFLRDLVDETELMLVTTSS